MGSYISAPYLIATIIISALYYILLHSSTWQATIGKRFMGIKVATVSGEQVTVGRAAVRFIVMEVVSTILYIGYFFMSLPIAAFVYGVLGGFFRESIPQIQNRGSLFLRGTPFARAKVVSVVVPSVP